MRAPGEVLVKSADVAMGLRRLMEKGKGREKVAERDTSLVFVCIGYGHGRRVTMN